MDHELPPVHRKLQVLCAKHSGASLKMGRDLHFFSGQSGRLLRTKYTFFQCFMEMTTILFHLSGSILGAVPTLSHMAAGAVPAGSGKYWTSDFTQKGLPAILCAFCILDTKRG
jgi:hypothetical protein